LRIRAPVGRMGRMNFQSIYVRVHVTIYVQTHANRYVRDMTSEAEQAWRAIHHLHTRLAPSIDKRLKSSIGLTYSEYETLSQLKMAAGPVKMADLALFVAVTRTHASRLIDELELVGLAKRESNPDDGRSFLVGITSDGIRRLAESAPEVERIFAESFGSRVSAKELLELAKGVERAVAAGT